MIRLIYALFSVALCLLLCVSARADALTMTDRIAAVLLDRPRHASDANEDSRNREARLRDEAAAISSGVHHAACTGAWAHSDSCVKVWRGSLTELSAGLLAIVEHESHSAAYVATGNCAAGPAGARCDNGRARTVFQVWKTACPDVWQTDPGSEAEMRTGAYCAARLLSSALRFCTEVGEPPNWPGAYGRYAGQGCGWIGGQKREMTRRKLLVALQRVTVAPQDQPLPEQPWPAEPKLP